MSGLGVSCSRCARCPQAPPDEQPDEVFAVAQSGGAVKWACAQYAKAWDGAENSGWSRIATEAANRTVWMKYSSPNGVVRESNLFDSHHESFLPARLALCGAF